MPTKGKTLSIKDAKSNILNIEENETLKAYIKNISKYKPLTVEEEKKLFTKYETADKERKTEIRNEIMKRSQMFIFSIAKKYANDDNISDLISEGNLGLDAAFKDFDIKSGNRFCTYATFHIRKNILKYMNEVEVLIKRKNNERVQYLLEKVRDQFIEENGCQPTYDDIRQIFEDEYGIRIAKNEDVYELYFNHINSFWDDEDLLAFENSKEFTQHTYTNNECLDTFDNEYRTEIIEELSKFLTDNEKAVIEMTYGFGCVSEPVNGREIGEILGVSHERVRQIKNRAMEKMQMHAAEVVARV